MKGKLTIFLCLICVTNMFSQIDTIITADEYIMKKKSAVYIEVLGNSATGFSVNYDRIIKEYKNGFLNTTIGYGNYLFVGEPGGGFNIPFSLNYTFFRSAKNVHLELGLGSGINSVK